MPFVRCEVRVVTEPALFVVDCSSLLRDHFDLFIKASYLSFSQHLQILLRIGACVVPTTFYDSIEESLSVTFT